MVETQGSREEKGNMKKRVAVLPGDGIGIDVCKEGVKVLDALRGTKRIDIEMVEFDYGADRYLKTGETLPDEALEDFKKNFHAVYLGALGDPRVPDMRHARDILLGMRFKLDLYVNFRPVKLFDERLCPLKGKRCEDLDFVVFRENTEGLYAGLGGIFKQGTPDEIAINEDINTRKGVERIVRRAFEYARENGRRSVTMSDKSNALRFAHDLWQRVFDDVGKNFPEIEKQHLYVDALVMQMVKKPEQFEVIVTCNMFGDIVTDLGAQLQGGMGLAASGNINPGHISMFEPVHGSAPKYAGKDVSNPLAAILTAGLMIETLGMKAEGKLIEDAVKDAVRTGNTTRDLGGKLGTRAVGDWVAKWVKERA